MVIAVDYGQSSNAEIREIPLALFAVRNTVELMVVVILVKTSIKLP